MCSWPVEVVSCCCNLSYTSLFSTDTKVDHGWGWSCAPCDRRKQSSDREEKQRHTYTQKPALTASPGFAAEVTLTTSSRWNHLNHHISAGNHPCVQANTVRQWGWAAQTTVTQGYITFLLSGLKSVNIDSWTHLFYRTSLFWFYSDVLTGLTSHFGTRSFVSRRIFAVSLILGVLGAEGCCRKCRISAYIEQKERKRDPWNSRGKYDPESKPM